MQEIIAEAEAIAEVQAGASTALHLRSDAARLLSPRELGKNLSSVQTLCQVALCNVCWKILRISE